MNTQPLWAHGLHHLWCVVFQPNKIHKRGILGEFPGNAATFQGSHIVLCVKHIVEKVVHVCRFSPDVGSNAGTHLLFCDYNIEQELLATLPRSGSSAYNKREKVARVTTKQQQKKEGASFSNVIAWALPVSSAEI